MYINVDTFIYICVCVCFVGDNTLFPKALCALRVFQFTLDVICTTVSFMKKVLMVKTGVRPEDVSAVPRLCLWACQHVACFAAS